MLVTIGLPFSDQDEYFEETLKSIFLQTHRDWRLILMADGASPRCLELAKRAAADPRVTLEENPCRRGLAAMLNRIADMATTEFLFRMDADDVMFRTRVEDQIRLLTSTGAQIVGSRAVGIDGASRVRGMFIESELPERPMSSLKSHLFTHPTVAGRADWFRQHRYDESFLRAEDKELWLRSYNSSLMLKSPEPTLFYRVRMPLDWRRRASSSKYDRRAVWKSGKSVAGIGRSVQYLAKSYALDAIYRVADQLGASDRVHLRKFASPSEGERSAWSRELANIRDWRLEDLV